MAEKRGRPTKLKPTIQGLLCDAISKGLPYNHACSLVGICYQTMRDWIAKGEKQSTGLYLDFLVAIKRAEAIAVSEAPNSALIGSSRIVINCLSIKLKTYAMSSTDNTKYRYLTE